MKLIILGFVLGSCVTNILTADVRLVDLEPNDAAQYINKQDQSLRYAPKIETNVPALRFIGKQQQHVVEDIYLANQYHGQDGLGAYVYGYSVPDSAKTEKKERSGDLKGAYEYVAGNGQEIKVQYWDDGTGFHQIDNVPKNLPEDDPDVKAAKEEHLRIWHEQALRNSIAPTDPNQQYFQQQYQYQTQPAPQQVPQYQPQVPIGHSQGYVGYNQGYQPQRPTIAYASNPNSVEYAGQYSSNQQAYVPAPGNARAVASDANAAATDNSDSVRAPAVQYQGDAGSASQVSNLKPIASQGSDVQHQVYQTGRISRKHEEEEGVTGPPKGFFYSFDYPVGIIVGKGGQQKLDNIYNQNKEYYEQQLKARPAA